MECVTDKGNVQNKVNVLEKIGLKKAKTITMMRQLLRPDAHRPETIISPFLIISVMVKEPVRMDNALENKDDLLIKIL